MMQHSGKGYKEFGPVRGKRTGPVGQVGGFAIPTHPTA
jgi:hypothetical protein